MQNVMLWYRRFILLFSIYYLSNLLVVTTGSEFGLGFVLPHCCVLILPLRSLLLCL